jgi:hypothetical protein
LVWLFWAVQYRESIEFRTVVYSMDMERFEVEKWDLFWWHCSLEWKSFALAWLGSVQVGA